MVSVHLPLEAAVAQGDRLPLDVRPIRPMGVEAQPKAKHRDHHEQRSQAEAEAAGSGPWLFRDVGSHPSI